MRIYEKRRAGVWMLLGLCLLTSVQTYAIFSRCNTNPERKRLKCEYPSNPFGFIGSIIEDTFYLHYNLLTLKSVEILAAFFPVFIGSRMIDERLQNKFFCFTHKKNCWQLPSWCHTVAQFSIGVEALVAAGMWVFTSNEELKLASRMLIIGLPFLTFGKDVLKGIEAEACLRPWHEEFCHDGKRHGGGFPSGHMAQMTYAAVLFGSRFGWKYAVPLSLATASLGAIFLNCNRHYLSQLVAGAALGTIYAYAANKLIDSKLAERLSITAGVSANGECTVGCSYQF